MASSVMMGYSELDNFPSTNEQFRRGRKKNLRVVKLKKMINTLEKMEILLEGENIYACFASIQEFS